MDRRKFIGQTAQAAVASACAGLFWYTLLQQQAQAAVRPLRPPGAQAEQDFAATCIKCGLCVQACPYGTLRLVKTSKPGIAGTPTFVPREVPCYMCVDIPCARVCPTGALDPHFPAIEQARMGLAVIDPENCLSWQGLRCEVCYRACPLRGKAISVATHPRGTSKHAVFVPVVHAEACTGCGLCEERCPTEVAAIRIVDPKLVRGRIGAHYRLQTAPAATATTPAAAEEAPVSGSGRPAAALDYLNRGAR